METLQNLVLQCIVLFVLVLLTLFGIGLSIFHSFVEIIILTNVFASITNLIKNLCYCHH